jgi:hypothetical protein
MGNIKFVGVGADENGSRFLKVSIAKSSVLLSVKHLVTNTRVELARLAELGAPLLTGQAQREFLTKAQELAEQEPTFHVATRVGLFGDEFIFPNGAVPRGSHSVELYLDERQGDMHRKFHRAGSLEGYEKLVNACKGNSRLIAGFALVFAGAPCAAFGLDPPGLQFKGPGGCAKTPAARIVSSPWGWDMSPGARLGFGTSWNSKPDALEVAAAGCGNAVLFLDEMSMAKGDVIDTIMRLGQGEGKARYTEVSRLKWCLPLLSTSNASVLALLKGSADAAAYIDRLMDVPMPEGCDCFFEDLHGFQDVAGYCAHLDDLAKKNHGHVGRWFAWEFVLALKADREELKTWFLARREDYLKAAAGTRAGERKIRVDGRHATIYAAGRLATRFGLFPVSKEELLDAVLKCERDHVALIARERGEAAEVAQRPFDRLNKYVRDRRDQFVDLRRPDTRLPLDHNHDRCFGYIGEHDGRREYWLTNERFQGIAEGKNEAVALKRDLNMMGQLATDRRGDALSFVVKRHIPGVGRVYVVALIPKSRKG